MSPIVDTGPSGWRRLLSNAGFRNLLLATVTTSLGDWIGLFAILSLTEKIEGSGSKAAFALSGVMIARVLPTLLFGPIAGVFADRWDRKRTMVATDIGRGLVMFAIVFANDVFQLFVATLVVEILAMLFIPAKDATLPNLVEDEEDLVLANQMSLFVIYGMLPVGAGLFAVLTALSSAIATSGFLAETPQALAIWVNAGTFMISATFIGGIPLEAMGRTREAREVRERGDGPNAWEELKEGFVFIGRHPLIGALVSGVMAAFFAAGVVMAIGPLFTRVVNAGESGFGIIGAVVGFGLMAGLASAGRLSDRIGKERLFAPGIGVAGIGLFLSAISPRLDVALVPAFIMGAGAGVAFLVGYTMLQQYVDDELRGRTFAVFNSGARLALFLSLVIGPAFVGIIGRAAPDAATGIYPYNPFVGERLVLMGSGALALVGAVLTGRSIFRVLTSGARTGEAPPSPHGLPGLFVVFEGGEGAGKSTQLDLVTQSLAALDLEVIVTREPGGTELGEQLRDVVLRHGSAAVGSRAEALIYAAARAQHADEVLRPALERGAVVLCDRYIDSSIVYQGTARGLGNDPVKRLNAWATDELLPDMVVLLDIDAAVGLRRAAGVDAPDRLESAGLPFHRTVNEAFRELASEDVRRWLVLDGTAEPATLTDDVLNAMAKRRPTWFRVAPATVEMRVPRAGPPRPPPEALEGA